MKQDKKIEEFVSPDLRHHKADATPEQMHEGLALMAYELHRAFNEMAAGNTGSYELIDSIRGGFSRLIREVEPGIGGANPLSESGAC